jgi:hypothetical protein
MQCVQRDQSVAAPLDRRRHREGRNAAILLLVLMIGRVVH